MTERFDPARYLHLYGNTVRSLADIALGDTNPHGWHGTSVEAAIYLNQYYRLPADEAHGPVLFYASCDVDPVQAKKDAVMYAKLNAVKQYVRQQLLPFKPSDSHVFAGALESDSCDRDALLEEAGHAGITKAKFLEHLRVGESTRHGVLLGISTTADRDFIQVSTGQAHDTEVALRTPGGLPIKYVTNIVPLGPYEDEVIHTLRQQA